MIALDTNILARFLLNDDSRQAQAARTLLAQNEIYTAPVTVLLELVWVLEANDCSRAAVSKALRVLSGLPNFKPKELTALLHALACYEKGMDFSDALHLALSETESAFLSFDRRLNKQAKQQHVQPKVSAP